ncbi:hypothetical protein [Gordonia soli]|nr:hypothetical protein [Gordonia soli]
MSGAATHETTQCPDDWAGTAGTPGNTKTGDINKALRDELALVGAIYTSESRHSPSVSSGRPQKLSIGGRAALHVVATARDIEASKCVGESALHSIVATTVPGQPGVTLFVISLPQGVPDAGNRRLINQMVTSLRPID